MSTSNERTEAQQPAAQDEEFEDTIEEFDLDDIEVIESKVFG